MSDDQDRAGDLLIQEVDDDLRREQYQKLWQQYGKYAIAGAVAIVLGVAGRQGWQEWRNRTFQREAAQFVAAEDLLAADKKDEAQAKLADIARGGKGGFAVAAALKEAELQSEAGNPAGAQATYDALAGLDAPQVFRDLATVKGRCCRSIPPIPKRWPKSCSR